MRNTIENEPVSFGAFNNGITMVCRNATVENGKLISIESPSIVNGGQTTVVIQRLILRAGIFASHCTLKLVELKMNPAQGELFEKQISRFSNTQNNIKGTDQMVNEEPHPS